MAPSSLLRFLVICYFSFILLAKSPRKNYGGCPLDYYNCWEFGNSDTYNSRCGLNIRGCDKLRAEEVQLGNRNWYEIIAADLPNEPYSIIVQDKELQEPLLSTICNASFNYDLPLLPGSTILPLEIANIIILYKCNRTPNLKLSYSFLSHSCPDYDIHYIPSQDDQNLYDSFNSCSKIHLPVDPTFFQEQDLDPFDFLSSKIHIQVNLSKECVQCYKTADICIPDKGRFHCRKDFRDNKLGGALMSATEVVFALGVLLFFVLSYYRFDLAPLWKNVSKAHHDFEAFLKNGGSAMKPSIRRSELGSAPLSGAGESFDRGSKQ
ncbi:hypothetical protein L6164_001708 [Bauhinia variegata]|uniref:Uncharacterized protein n=1 Tax=Bauhinia variegata TaxID=167791 RepID=A0ACB9QCS6_BAUVA|nr:hypothetical protein L6164_001708 [Bauhinia variegata]